MNFTKTLMVVSFVFATASVWACGDDDPATPAASDACPKDDPETLADESECAAIADAASGLEAINKRGCKTCHGEDMAGQSAAMTGKQEYEKTVTGLTVKLYPPNLTNDATGILSWSDDALATAIRTGYDNESQALCPQMQHFSNMSDFEVYSIVKYLRSAPPVSKQIPRSICPPTKTE